MARGSVGCSVELARFVVVNVISWNLGAVGKGSIRSRVVLRCLGGVVLRCLGGVVLRCLGGVVLRCLGGVVLRCLGGVVLRCLGEETQGRVIL